MQVPYIPEQSLQSAESPKDTMALSFDAQMNHQDDLAHDSLMGLQELDSHLAIFEESSIAAENIAKSAMMSESASDPFYISQDESGQKITGLPQVVTFEDPGPSALFSDQVESTVTKEPLAVTDLKNDGFVSSSDNSGEPRLEGPTISTSVTESDYQNSASALSSMSSKATSPAEPEFPIKSVKGRLDRAAARRKFEVRARQSIPTDISHQEYARQCVAAAESSRLNPYGLHPEEYKLLRPHLTESQVTTYLNLRNGILRLWTRNPLIRVHKEEAIGCARDARWFDTANICYEWLVRKGFINYGCVENLEMKKRPKLRTNKKKTKTIVVIGAGISGLGCARQIEGLLSQFQDELSSNGEEIPKVVLLEGRDRIGGRVHSRAFKSKPEGVLSKRLHSGQRHTAEMGGMIITGFDRGNPLNIIVRGQLALPYHALRPTTTLHDFDGLPVDPVRDQLVEKLFNDVLDRVSDYKFKVPQPPTVEGDKDLIDASKDATQDSGKLLVELEEAVIKAETSVELVPVSSDRLTGRAHVEPGIPALHKAGFKAQSLGWELKPGVESTDDLELGTAAQAENATLGSVMDSAIHQYQSVVDLTPQDLRLINWHVANLEYSNATSCRELSLGGWDLDAGNEWEGKHTMLIGGYQQVPRGLLHCPQPLRVEKNRNIKRIVYNPGGDSSTPSKVECNDGTIIEADFIVSTVPLGVLKKQSIQFEPPLPDWKTGAINRLGYGVLNKIVLIYKEPFWDPSRDIFGILREPADLSSMNQRDYASQRGRFFQWFNCTETSGVPCLLALMAGDASYETERTQNDLLVAEATEVLKSVFGPAVPPPVEAIITRWGQDPFSYGSYSYTSPSFQPDDYTVMARPIGNLFFAGEHTCGTHPATVHGAYLSGLRAADEVLQALIGPIVVPEPLVLPKDYPNVKRKPSEPLPSPRDPKQARLDAYEAEVWAAMCAKLGDRPLRPAKVAGNPYILYGKDNFETAKRKCEEGRRPGKGKPAPNEVRVMLARLWKEASAEEKQPYIEKAEEQKRAYAASVKEFLVKVVEWDKEGYAFREQYAKEHPIPNDDLDSESPGRKERRAKRHSG